MKRRFTYLSVLVCLATLVLMLPLAAAENYGQLRALKRRAATVTRQKNEFVTRVLRSYEIPYQRTEQGIVAQLQIGTRWFDVNRIDIVPLARDGENGLQVVAHEIFFYTESDTLHLVSPLTIR
jgi:hypothetical protein